MAGISGIRNVFGGRISIIIAILFLSVAAGQGVSCVPSGGPATRSAASAAPSSGGPAIKADGPRVALVIGNGAYSSSPLSNPVNDAADMAAMLDRLGFKVTKLTDGNLRSMENAVREFGRRIRQGGVGLFFYAGHGIQVGGVNYLVPTDARIEKEQDVKFECLDANRVLGEMDAANNGLNILVLDACRDNPFARAFRSSSQGLAQMDAPTGTFIAFATAPGSVASDGAGRNGVFTSHLLKNMDTPGLKIEDLMKQVRIGVREETQNKQTPWQSSSLMGDFYFRPGEAPKSAAAPSSSGAGVKAGGERTPAGPTRGKTFTNSIGQRFVWAPAGEFTMGSLSSEPGRDDDEKQRPVTLSSGFYIQATEVTQAQWRAVMGNNPARFTACGDDCPVEQVSYRDVLEFIRRLNAKEGTDAYRLPTEAEWEYAARAGTGTAIYTGPIDILGANNAPALDPIAWYGGNSGVDYAGSNCSDWPETQHPAQRCGTHPAGKKKPNAWGIFDMLGNVSEWCADRYAEQPRGGTDPAGPDSGEDRVRRGGAWNGRSWDCRAADRDSLDPEKFDDNIGFRLVLTN